MVKGFAIAMLAVGTALFLAALLLPDHRQQAPRGNRQFAPTVATVDTNEMAESQKHRGLRTMPPQPATATIPSGGVSVRHSTDKASYSVPKSNKPEPEPTPELPIDSNLTADEELTIKQTGTDDTSLRNADFPRTYISKIHVDLASPNHWVTLTWSGPNVRQQVTTKFHSSPGRGLGNNNCDDPAESCRVDSNCTPKGTHHVQAFSNTMVTSPACRYVTWFDTKRGIALHYYPSVPNYPASHGCVRLGEYAARLIHNNSKIGETEVTIEGKWKYGG